MIVDCHSRILYKGSCRVVAMKIENYHISQMDLNLFTLKNLKEEVQLRHHYVKLTYCESTSMNTIKQGRLHIDGGVTRPIYEIHHSLTISQNQEVLIPTMKFIRNDLSMNK